jgi:hypothetical protein
MSNDGKVVPLNLPEWRGGPDAGRAASAAGGGGEDFDNSPSWSPDGTRIAFLSRRDIPEDPLDTGPCA